MRGNLYFVTCRCAPFPWPPSPPASPLYHGAPPAARERLQQGFARAEHFAAFDLLSHSEGGGLESATGRFRIKGSSSTWMNKFLTACRAKNAHDDA